jgi:two-component system cell cycle response regulator
MNHTILVVDDAPSNVRILEKMLSKEGYDLVSADSGPGALQIVRTRDVSCVLMDVQMPGMDGYEVARLIQKDPRICNMPIIFVTSNKADEANVLDSYEAGGVDYLVKPVVAAVVRRKVQIFCALQEKEKQIRRQFAEVEQKNLDLEKLILELRVLDEARMESEIRYRSLISLSPQPIVVQVGGAMVYYNASATQMLGFTSDVEMCGRPFHEFVCESDRAMVQERLDHIARCGGRSEPLECKLLSAGCDPPVRHVELHIGCILYDDAIGIQMAIQDITTHKQMQEKLLQLSQADGLTGIANRRAFDEILAREWSRAIRHDEPLSLLLFDLDKFKDFNDEYGHLAGDECLKQTARLLKSAAARPTDFAARFGGEEFVILLPNTDSIGAQHVANVVIDGLAALKIAHRRNRNGSHATVSCGIATSGLPACHTPEGLIHLADTALYRAKTAGGDQFQVSG